MMEKYGSGIFRGEGISLGRFHGRIAAVICLCLIFLTGCGEAKVPDVVDTPSVAVSKEGEVTVWQVGLFDKSDYILSELQSMAVEEAGRFNIAQGKESAVAVEKVEALEDGSGKVVVQYRFDGWVSCTAYLKEELFYGTVAESAMWGLGTGISLKSVKDGTPLSETELGQKSGSYLIVTDMKANVYCPGKVTHISEGAEVNQDGSIDTSGADGRVYILFNE